MIFFITFALIYGKRKDNRQNRKDSDAITTWHRNTLLDVP